MKTQKLLSLSLLALLFTGSVNATALSNGGFESWSGSPDPTITDWTSFGGPEISSSVVNQGSYSLQLDTESIGFAAVSIVSLESFFGVSAGSLNALSQSVYGSPADGLGISQTFSTATASTLSFAFRWATEESASLHFNDTGFYVLDGTAHFLADILSPQNIWSNLTPVALSAGTHTLGFGIYNKEDTFGNSTLYVDSINIAAVAVPEPSTYVLLAAMLLLFACWRTRASCQLNGRSAS